MKETLAERSVTGERDYIDDDLTRPRLARALAMYNFCLPYVRERLVVEVGCGTGYGVGVLGQQAARVIGIDFDPSTIAEARRHYGNAKTDFEVMDGCDMTFADNSIDAVVSILVIEHIKDVRRFVAEASRVLGEGGVFVLGALNRATSMEDDAYHYREYTHDDLRELLSPHFAEIEVFGLRGATPRAVLERQQRIDRAMKYWRYDVLRLRRFYPIKCLYRPIFNQLQQRGRQRRSTLMGNEFENMNERDFTIEADNLDQAWTLLSVARKGG